MAIFVSILVWLKLELVLGGKRLKALGPEQKVYYRNDIVVA